MSKKLPAESQDKIIVFGAKKIRREWVDEEWFFSVVDIVGALTDSPNPRNYWNMMKAREKEASEVQLSTICVQLKLTSADGKSYKTDAVYTESGGAAHPRIRHRLYAADLSSFRRAFVGWHSDHGTAYGDQPVANRVGVGPRTPVELSPRLVPTTLVELETSPGAGTPAGLDLARRRGSLLCSKVRSSGGRKHGLTTACSGPRCAPLMPTVSQRDPR